MLKNKALTILITALLTFSMTASLMLMQNAQAHTPAWNIPTYAYINAEPNPIGVGQSMIVYMWLDAVYGAAGGSTAAVGTNGYTASAALLSNNYRFHNYDLYITSPSGTTTEVTFPVVTDSTSSQLYDFTPDTLGTYTLNFTFPGQVYGANGDGYSGSVLIGDYYEPSSATTTLTVQSTPIPNAITSEPLPTNYWTEPIYGENTNWYTLSSNWLGQSPSIFGAGAPVPAHYTTSSIYHGDAVGPLTSHIMWTKPIMAGGVVGGNLFPSSPGVGYYEGSAYQPRFYNPIIMNGILYYTEAISFTGSNSFFSGASGPTVAVDLRTGEVLWSNPNMPEPSFGYIYNVEDPDQHGVFPPIIVVQSGGFNFFAPQLSTPVTWQMYDAYTGDSLFNVTNIPAFPATTTTAVAGPNGEILMYCFTNVAPFGSAPNWYLSEWNSSRLWLYDINPYTGGGSLSPSIVRASDGALISQLPIPITGESGTLPNGQSVFIPYGSSLTVNANVGIAEGIAASSADPTTTYDWNISVPWLNTMITPGTGFGTGPGASAPTILAADTGNVMLCENGSLPTGFATTGNGAEQGPYTLFTVNLNSSVGAVGSVLWSKTYSPPPGNITLEFGAADFQTNVFVMSYEETIQWVGYSMTNGNQLWGPTTPEVPFDYYGQPGVSILIADLAYGNLYDSSFGGVVYCRNEQTGDIEWTYGNGGPGNSTNAGFNTAYGDYPTFIQSIANGVVYIATDEHTITDPIYKGATSAALNATTGEQIWQLSDYPSEWSGAGTQWVVADGYATFMNGYDDQIYSVGRGASATTVTAGPQVTTLGNNVVISGTVMDTSAGTQQSEQKADFPNGVPCSSDSSMMQWMGYVYQQQAEPTNFTGVDVQLAVLDSNGNHYPIGTATTDESGMYTLTYKPAIAGNFTVFATFAGTNGYWPSYSETSFNVMQATATAPPSATPVTGLATQNTVEYIGVAIIIVIIIIGAVLAILVTRKRP